MMKSVVATALLATAALAQEANTKTYTVDLTVAANKTAFDAAIADADETTEPEKAAGACNGLLNIVNDVKIGDATVTVFEPKVALADACATALKVDNKEIFTAYNGLCLTARADPATQADPATGFDFTANKGGQLCPLDQGAKCVKDQYCAGIDGEDADVCQLEGTETQGTCGYDSPSLADTNVVKAAKAADFNAAIADDGACKGKVVSSATILETTVFVFSTNPVDDACFNALNPGTPAVAIYTTEEDNVCFVADTEGVITYNAGGKACPLEKGKTCTPATQWCQGINDNTEAIECPTEAVCPSDTKVDLTVTYTVPTDNAQWVAATKTDPKGACVDHIVQGANVAGTTTFVFNTATPNAACVTALTHGDKKVYEEKKTTTCFAFDTTDPTKIVPSPGQNAVCPLAQAAECKKDQFCAPYDGKAAAKCPVADDATAETKGTCPKDSPAPTGALKTTFKCGEVCADPLVLPTAFNDCMKTHTSSEAYTSKCTGSGYATAMAPTNKKRTEMNQFQAFADKEAAKACVDVIDGFKSKVEECLKNANSDFKASYEAVALDAACVDSTNRKLLCKTADGCKTIPCPDGTDCTANKDVCGGECAEGATEGKKECTSAATQLVAGVVAVAALAVAFF